MKKMPKILVLAVILIAIAAAFGNKSAAGEQDEEIVELFTEEQIPKNVDFTRCESTSEDMEKKWTEPWYSEEEAALLARLAMAEAEGESIEGKAMVILTALNRVESDEFPNTIEEVIFQEASGKYQFSSVTAGGRWYQVEANGECYEALELIESGWDESEGCLYFEAVSNGSNTWHTRNLEYITTIGGHNFYK